MGNMLLERYQREYKESLEFEERLKSVVGDWNYQLGILRGDVRKEFIRKYNKTLYAPVEIYRRDGLLVGITNPVLFPQGCYSYDADLVYENDNRSMGSKRAIFPIKVNTLSKITDVDVLVSVYTRNEKRVLDIELEKFEKGYSLYTREEE